MTHGICGPTPKIRHLPDAAWGQFAGTLMALLLLLAGTDAGWAGGGSAAVPGIAVVTGTAASPSCNPLTRFNRHNFTHSTTLNNRLLPLKPGTRFDLEGQANRGSGLLPHRVVTIVTDLTKVIHGVRTRVVVELDINAGQLEEAELAFFAQDDIGNVWHLGEYPEEYEDGKFSGAPDVWIAGVAGAQAGINMPAKPRLGMPSYREGFAPNIEFFDCGRVLKTGGQTCVPGKCYDNVVVIDEWDPLDPGSGHQRKFHAEGVGIVRVGAVNDPEAETLVLSDAHRIGPKHMADARKLALRLERHAYQVSDVYRHTLPAK